MFCPAEHEQPGLFPIFLLYHFYCIVQGICFIFCLFFAKNIHIPHYSQYYKSAHSYRQYYE